MQTSETTQALQSVLDYFEFAERWFETYQRWPLPSFDTIIEVRKALGDTDPTRPLGNWSRLA